MVMGMPSDVIGYCHDLTYNTKVTYLIQTAVILTGLFETQKNHKFVSICKVNSFITVL